MTEYSAVACHVNRGTSVASARALAWVILSPGGGDSTMLLIRSRSGRWVKRWERTKNLTDLRVKTVVSADAVSGRLIPHTREEAEDLVVRLTRFGAQRKTETA